MVRRKKEASVEPLRWRITEKDGRLWVVEQTQAPPLGPGEKVVWEGAAKHIVEAYRQARDGGVPVYLSRDGFKLRNKPSGNVATGTTEES